MGAIDVTSGWDTSRRPPPPTDRLTNVHEERLELGAVPAKLYTTADAQALLLLGHGGGQSKDAPRFVELARRYVEQTGLAVVCIDAVDHGERKPPAATADLP